ncbi:hypothetical protein J6590_023669 [Homalodisca vitripennis]|nr:hypothetical protein J6590_023669 [Homalodisca vitripennis]
MARLSLPSDIGFPTSPDHHHRERVWLDFFICPVPQFRLALALVGRSKKPIVLVTRWFDIRQYLIAPTQRYPGVRVDMSLSGVSVSISPLLCGLIVALLPTKLKQMR